MSPQQLSDDGSTRRRSILRKIAAAGTISTAAIAAGSSSASAQDQQTVPWGGQGSENALQPCPGGTAVWNWVLSTGGMNVRIDPEITVEYEDMTTQTVPGTPIGQNNVQFQVTRAGGGTVQDATATYFGTIGPGTPILTISSSDCIDPEPPNDDVTPAEEVIDDAVDTDARIEQTTGNQSATQEIETGDAESSANLEQTETNVQDGEATSGDVTGIAETVADAVEKMRHR